MYTLPRPKPGTRRWSNYFGQYVTVTLYLNDNHWYFKLDDSLRNYRAQTNFSEMPVTPPLQTRLDNNVAK